MLPADYPLEEQQGDQDYRRHPPEDPGQGRPQDWQQEEVWF